MDQLIAKVLSNLQDINWESPAAFVIALIAVFALMKRWSLVLLIVLTVVLGWGAEDMIILNLTTEDRIVSLPFLIYIVGSLVVFLFAMTSFFKSK